MSFPGASRAQAAVEHPWVDFVRRVVTRQSDERLAVTAASMAFWIVIGLLPGLIAALQVLSLALDPQELQETVDLLRQDSPDSVSTLVLDQVRAALATGPTSFGLAFVLALLALLWTASSAYANFNRGTRQAYGLPPRPFLTGRARALGGALLVVTVVAALILVLAGTVRATSTWEGPSRWIVTAAGAVFDFAVLVALLVGLMRLATGRQSPRPAYLPGGVFAAVGIALVAVVYGAVMLSSGSYQSVYGALAGVIVLMLLFYFSCWITLIGAAVNAEWRLADR